MIISKRTVLAVAILVTLSGPETVSGQSRSSIAPMSPVSAKLTIPDAKLLPGVPFDLWIQVSNDSDSTVGVGLCADMVVRTEEGESFTVGPPRQHSEGSPDYPVLLPDYDASDAGVSYLVLAPRQRQTLTLPILPGLSGPNYFHDARLSNPGRYAISVRLDYCWPGSVTPQNSLLPATFLGPVSTNEVTVERIIPTGTDAVVWQRMQELSREQWSAIGWKETEPGWIVTKEITSKYPDSNYLPYALLARGGSFDVFLDAIHRFPDSPVVDLLHRAAAISARDGRQSAAQMDIVKQSKRPTTRILIFGREDVKRP